MKRPHSSSRLLTLLLLLGFWIAAGVVAPTGLWDPWPMARAQSRIDELKGKKGEGVRSDDIPSGEEGWAFRLGSGAETDRLTPATYSQKVRLDANFSAGFGYSCGSFDPFDNVEAMINSAIEKFKQLPQKFVDAAQGAVAALPAYLLNKINPSLYNVVTKQLDEAFKLFEINFKDCQQMEREMALGQNPYQNLVMAGMGDRMRIEMGFGDGTIDDRMKKVRTESASNGIVLTGGKRYGGVNQPPIEATKTVLTAGINLLADRDVDDTNDFNAALHDRHPITKVFKSPPELVAFITAIYGGQAFMLTKTGPTQSTPGSGYLKPYIEARDHAIEQLQKYVRREIDRQAFESSSGMLIPPATIEEMRQLPPYALSISIDDQARQFALNQLKLKFDFALQALKTGLHEPNLSQSEAYEVVEREVNKLKFAILDDIAHINTATFLQ
mgnify:FL=1